MPIAKDVLETLGPGDFLLRVYRHEEQSDPAADLFIAYFPGQRTGDTIHKNVLFLYSRARATRAANLLRQISAGSNLYRLAPFWLQ